MISFWSVGRLGAVDAEILLLTVELRFAGNSVAVSVEMGCVARLALMDVHCARGSCLVAVLVVGEASLGSGSGAVTSRTSAATMVPL